MRKNKLLALAFIFLLFACYHEDDYLLTNIDAGQIIKNLYTTQDQILADGQSYTYIIAELPSDAVDSRASVVFTTTKGTFENNTKTITLLATMQNVEGQDKRIAKVKLISSVRIETAEVTATVANISKTIGVSFTNLPYEELLTVNSSAAEAPADGASAIYLTAEQPLNTADSQASIIFTTTAGNFDNGTRTITKPSVVTLIDGVYKRTSKVRLTSGKTVELASIDITTSVTAKSLTVDFVRAYPEYVNVTVSAAAIQTGFNNTMTITTQLLRSIGVPSINSEIALRVVDASGADHGTFINFNNKSNAEGKVVNSFTLGADTYQGPLFIKATATDAQGLPIISQYPITAL